MKEMSVGNTKEIADRHMLLFIDGTIRRLEDEIGQSILKWKRQGLRILGRHGRRLQRKELGQLPQERGVF